METSIRDRDGKMKLTVYPPQHDCYVLHDTKRKGGRQESWTLRMEKVRKGR